MEVTAFPEVVEVMKYRKRITLKNIADHIGTSPQYANEVIKGQQNGPKATEYRKKIAAYLGIALVTEL